MWACITNKRCWWMPWEIQGTVKQWAVPIEVLCSPVTILGYCKHLRDQYNLYQVGGKRKNRITLS
jgi:hypothetical protein